MSRPQSKKFSIKMGPGLPPTAAAVLALGLLLLVFILVWRAYELRVRWKDGEFEMRPTATRFEP